MMNDWWLKIFYGSGAFFFIKFFLPPLFYILIILLLAGFAILILKGGHSRFWKEFFLLISVFLWLFNIFSFSVLNWPFSLCLFFVFWVIFVALLIELSFLSRFFSLSKNRRQKLVYAFSGALIMSEFFWATSFLPFGHLILASLSFIVFYFIWDIFSQYWLGNLNKQAVLKNLIFSSALIIILLLTTKWQI